MQHIVNRKVLVSMIFLSLTMLGYISYKQLKVELFPGAELPYVVVQVNSRIEVTPEYMEEKAIVPIEGAIGGLEGIDLIESSAGNRRGSVQITYQDNVDFKYAYLKLEERINSIRGMLPEEFTLNISKASDQMQNANILLNLQVRGSGGTDRIRNIVEQKLKPALENVDGVALVNLYGGRQKSVEVILNKRACDAYNISPAAVRRALAANLQDRVYAGKVEDQGKRLFVYVAGEYTNVSDIENVIVDGNTLRLKDIATVFYGEKEETTISRINGKDAVSMVVINDAQANIIDLAHALRDEIERQNESLRYLDVEVVIQNDMAEIMESNIDQILNLALTGGMLAIFILWVFLRNISLVTIVALSMPVSVYIAFNFFYGYDLTINSLTLVGLALAVGMLLDNSIVVLENIYRLRSRGYSPFDSVVMGTKEVWRSVIASTLTTVTVFLPFIFSSNFFIKLFGKHIGVSIVSTLTISLIVALVLIPMAVLQIIKRGESKGVASFKTVTTDNRMVRIYLLLLKTALRNPAWTLIIGVVLFFVTMFGSLSISINTSKEVETQDLRVQLTMPTGSTIERTDEVLKILEEKVGEVAEIQDVISSIGEDEAMVTIKLKKDFEKINKLTQPEVKYNITKAIGSIEPAEIVISSSASASSQGSARANTGSRGGGNAGFMRMMGIGEEEDYIIIKGQDFAMMAEVADDLDDYLEEMEDMRSSRMSIRDDQPEVHIDFDRRLMSDYNLSFNDVSQELGSFTGKVSSNVFFKQGSEQYEITISYDEDTAEVKKNKTMDDLRQLKISAGNNQNGVSYELQNFSDIYMDRGMREIVRVNQSKQIQITYRFNEEIYESKVLLEAAKAEVQGLLDSYPVPEGIAVEMVHKESEMEEFYTLFKIAFLLIFMILAAVFESIITPFVLLFSVPLAAIGSFIFLIITGNSLLNSNTLTGFLILLGIVINNGIILIDFTNILRKQGYRRSRALVVASLSRVRPILITAITTCIAMLPLALGTAEYVSVIGVPFAITVIGGLSVSTILTLVFIPTLYSGLENAVLWFKSLPLWLRLAQGFSIIIGFVYINLTVDTFTWQLVDSLLLVSGIPAAVYFIRTSLKKASERVIPSNEPIRIQISNLVKVYGRPSRVTREYRAGKQMIEQKSVQHGYMRELLQRLIWQLPALGFLVFFGWFFVRSNFTTLLVALFSYLFLLNIIAEFRLVNKRFKAIFGIIYTVILYGAPLVLAVLNYFAWSNTVLVVLFTLGWYILLFARKTGADLIAQKTNTDSYPRIFRWFVRIVSRTPGVGFRKEPFKALKGVSLEITTGMFGLLGPNGAGKSTMMRIICGILEQSYGKIWINGIDTQEKREELQGLIGYLPQEFGMYENMTAHDYLDYQAILKGIYNKKLREERISYVLNAVHMFENRDKTIGSFSGGMKQRIGIAQILLHLPRILVVDEPTAGLDPRERIRFRNLLVELSRDRVVIFSTHIIEDISSSCNYMAVINRGNVVYKGTPAFMANEAENKVWRFSVPAKEFANLPKELVIVHHMREGDSVRIRCLSDKKPHADAVNETPLLEDAYLWLLKKGGAK